MKKLWKFEWDSDYAFIGGIFKATDEQIKNAIGKTIYLGEAEGKHSEVYGVLEENDIVLVSDNPIAVKIIPEFGYNPLGYISEEDV
ncbi:hypothetical protein DWW15_12945 [Subdoligranulum sp. AF14-43]|nr:hypothetical protein DWW15_12945 [Subdoligranulum sp. AF14-43]